MPYSILKLDIIMSRWDEKDPLIGTWHDPVQILNMGERGQYFCFFHRMLQEHASFQCDRLTCDLWVPWQWWQESCVECTKEEKSESSHLQTDKETSYLHHGLQQGVPTWCQLKIKTTKKADSWGTGTATEYWTRFHQRHCFWPFRPTPL